MNGQLTVGSLFSGVGGIDLGLERAGMRVVFQCEADAWCRGILGQHWPEIPCFDDVRAVSADALPSGLQQPVGVDLLCGGFPCQDLSVAGRRRGLAGERSGLFFEFARCADELVRLGGWLLVENVPGLLTSRRGRDFAIVVRTLGDIGFHDLAWRVLDSRYFGVPQRRRRVYIVGRRVAGRDAREVLLEPESGGGDFETGAEARPRVAASLASGSHRPGVSPPGRRQHDDINVIASTLKSSDRGSHGLSCESAAGGHLQVAPAIVRRYGKGTDSDATDTLIAHTLRAEGFDASEDGTGRGTPLVSASADSHGVRASSGLPGRVDDPRPDGPRYAAMGNAVTVPVAEWIGRRIVSLESQRRASEAA